MLSRFAELFDEVRCEITLGRGVRPYLRVRKQLPLRVEQEGDPVRGPRHGDSPDGEGRQHRVGEERGEVDHAPGGPDAADEAGADQDPRDQEGPDGMEARVALKVCKVTISTSESIRS